MRIAIACVGQMLEDKLDLRFGRATCFILIDADNFTFSAIDNTARSASSDAGMVAAQTIIDQSVDAVIVHELGPNALNVLSSAGIVVFQGIPGSAYNNTVAYNQKKLQRINESGRCMRRCGDLDAEDLQQE